MRQPPSGAGRRVPELVEALLGRRAQQPPAGAHDAARRHALPARARRVARERLRVGDLDQVADDPEARRARGLDVAAAVGRRGVGGVDDERLALLAGTARTNASSRARVRSRSIATRTCVSRKRSR